MSPNKRKQKSYQAKEKVAIIRRHLVEKVAVSDLCDEYGISPSLYYQWQTRFFEGGEKAFASTQETRVMSQLKEEINELEGKLARKDEVLGEVMAEFVMLKKTVGAVDRSMGRAR